MLYINIAKVRKLVGVRRVKKWIQPGETVDLDSFDVRNLGMNATFFEPHVPEKKEETPEPKEAADKAPEAVDETVETTDETAEASDEKEEVEKDAPPEKSKKEIEAGKKAAKKKEADARKALKESLEGMTKVRLIEVAEEVVGIDVKSRDTKDTILKQVLKASKAKGYTYVLENS